MELTKFFRIVIFLCLIFFNSCIGKQERNSIEEGTKLDQKPLSHKILIKGTSDDKTALEYLNITNNSSFFGSSIIDKRIKENSLQFIIDSIHEPQLFDFQSFGEVLYEGRFFGNPGDTIDFKIENGFLKFTGTNATLNNFYTNIEDATPKYSENPYMGSIYEYKKKTNAIYNEKKMFLDEYIKNNTANSNDFISIVKADLKHQYLYNLIYPRNIKAGETSTYYNEQDGLLPIIQKEKNLGDINHFNFVEYFDNITIDEFKNERLLNNSFYFKNNINAFIRNYFLSSEYLNYSTEKLFAEKEFIDKNFNQELKIYAIARMISDYDYKSFGYSVENINILKILIDEYSILFTKPSYKERMEEIKASLNAFDFKLSDAALNTKLLSTTGDTITLKNIFDRHSKKIKIIDFWASWCIPCIVEITKAKSFKDKLSVEEDVEWIYLSIDEDKQKWLKKSDELSGFFNTTDQYLILKPKISSLTNQLKVNSIPRYVVFDNQDNIVLDNAPRPSDSIVFKRMIHEIGVEK